MLLFEFSYFSKNVKAYKNPVITKNTLTAASAELYTNKIYQYNSNINYELNMFYTCYNTIQKLTNTLMPSIFLNSRVYYLLITKITIL